MVIRRKIKFLYQRLTRGWDDSDTWSLDYTCAKFLIPRLKRFQELNGGYPFEFNNIDEWHQTIDKMIRAFEIVEKDGDGDVISKSEEDEMELGLKLFHEFFRALWN